jgi:hypothetical protein
MSSYPFNDPDPVILKKYTDSVYQASQLSDIIRENQTVRPSFSFLLPSHFDLRVSLSISLFLFFSFSLSHLMQ